MEVRLRPLVIEDAYTSYVWRNDKEVFAHTGTIYTNEITLDMELEWIKKVINNKNEYRCAILADGEYVGNIYLTDIDSQKAIYHIFIGRKDLYGKGIASKASELILNHAKEALHLKFVELSVRKENKVAIHLYRKLGFKKIEEDKSFIYMQKLIQ